MGWWLEGEVVGLFRWVFVELENRKVYFNNVVKVGGRAGVFGRN